MTSLNRRPHGFATSGWLTTVRAFVHRHGWRAYALPVLTILTVLEFVRPGGVLHKDAARLPSNPPSGATSAFGIVAQRQIDLPLGVDATPCATNSQPRFILVSVSQQRTWMCEDATQVYSTLVTTGAVNVGDGTPLGTWHIQDKQTDRYLVGPGYRDFVHYWMPFNGDFGFHDAAWQTMPFGAPGYTDNGSHGCVHLPAAAMTWLFNWASIDTTVTIVS